MAEPFSMRDKVVVITGASRGIGQGLARYFAEQGARVVALARDAAGLEALAGEIRAAGGQCLARALDVRDVAAVRAVFDAIAAELGGIDVLVNNAGMGHPVPALEVTEADWDAMMSLNLKGTFFCAQAAARHMLARGRGRIVNISSQAAVIAIDGESVYCASKGGVNQLTKSLALEWSRGGVTVNAVGPRSPKPRAPGSAWTTRPSAPACWPTSRAGASAPSKTSPPRSSTWPPTAPIWSTAPSCWWMAAGPSSRSRADHLPLGFGLGEASQQKRAEPPA